MFAVLLPALCGIIGLMIDVGLLMAAQRQVQNAADAAALAAAFDLMRSASSSQVIQTANDFVHTYNGLTTATVTCSGTSGPSTGPNAGNKQFVEVIVSYPVSTFFIQVVGVSQNQTAKARAVAGYIALSAGEGVALLSPNATKDNPPGGLLIGGNGKLIVNGRIVINSQGKGLDQNYNTVDWGVQQYAADFSGANGKVQGTRIDVVGGVSDPSRFTDTSGNTGVLFAGGLPEPDPLANLPTPSSANNPNYNKFWNSDGSPNFSGPQAVSINNTVTLNPGVYQSIKLSSSKANVTFNPGIYIVGVGNSGSTTFDASANGAQATGTGVMFYNTGSDFNAATGQPDANDGNSFGTDASAKFGAFKFTGATINFNPISDVTSPFNGMVFYQRRWNSLPINMAGGAGISVSGTLYAKWGQASFSGNGSYSASSQFIVGSMNLQGNGVITVNYAGKKLGRANQVYLVE
jgi:hypothetical protein